MPEGFSRRLVVKLKRTEDQRRKIDEQFLRIAKEARRALRASEFRRDWHDFKRFIIPILKRGMKTRIKTKLVVLGLAIVAKMLERTTGVEFLVWYIGLTVTYLGFMVARLMGDGNSPK